MHDKENKVRVTRLGYHYSASETHLMPQFPKTEATVLSSFISIKRNRNEDLDDFYSSEKSTLLSLLSSAWCFETPSLKPSASIFVDIVLTSI